MIKIKDKPATTTQIYFWNMMGSFSNALCSFIFLMIVSRTLVEKQSDIFSLGFSIAQLMYTVATFQMRVFQATDVKEEFRFGQYFGFRICTSVFMIIATVIYIIINGYTGYKAIIIGLLCVYKMFDAVADVFEGLYQQKERLDLSGKFCTLRIIPTVILFAIVSMLFNELLYSTLAIVGTCFAVMFIYVMRHTGQFLNGEPIIEFDIKKMFSMLLKVCPIFIGGFILMYVFNVPKYAIDDATSAGVLSDGSQTIYNIIFMPASVINLLFIFFRPQITKMAIYYAEEEYSKLNRTAIKIALILIGFTFFAAIAGGVIGIPILGIIFAKNLNAVRIDLVIVMLGGGISAVATLVDNLLTIYRKQYLNLIGYNISLIIALIMGNTAVRKTGIYGASITYLVSMLVLLIVLLILYMIVSRRKTEG